ncbi:shikimate kinase [Aureitalea sp. L0-47]|uniref:shikimate kinase n=1 Tax=Aureitalea sp. L0-47 TaxID=2816962 RepID=UPI0022375E81|nr:shikimate kinase [Aureitalea sp. L0-47]MCW5519115.1 shikimate kinase [Aureitalea sp. L0-47]
MILVLIGYMGSGKTAVGKELASTLDFSFTDLDNYIEIQESKSIQELFATKGEIYFRRKESEAVAKVLNEKNKLVLATGGGTPCYGNTMNLFLESEQVRTIYLKASVDELTTRLFEERSKRPLIAHLDDRENLTDFIRKHLFERAPVYERSETIISVEGKSISEIVREIVLQLF